MMHRAWSSIVEVPYCFSRSYVKFQGHTALKIVEFDPNWAFPDCNSSLNSPMAMKCCTKLETAKERCPIVFQGHPSNFKVTRDKTSPILTQIGRFQTIGRSQLSNPSDLPCSTLHTNMCVSICISGLYSHVSMNQIIIKSPQYTGGDFMFLYRFVRRRHRCRRPQILVHAITFEQLFGFLSFLAQLLALTCRLPDYIFVVTLT